MSKSVLLSLFDYLLFFPLTSRSCSQPASKERDSLCACGRGGQAAAAGCVRPSVESHHHFHWLARAVDVPALCERVPHLHNPPRVVCLLFPVSISKRTRSSLHIHPV